MLKQSLDTELDAMNKRMSQATTEKSGLEEAKASAEEQLNVEAAGGGAVEGGGAAVVRGVDEERRRREEACELLFVAVAHRRVEEEAVGAAEPAVVGVLPEEGEEGSEEVVGGRDRERGDRRVKVGRLTPL